MFVFGLRPSTIVSMSEGSLSQAWEMLAIAPTAQNRRRTDARHWFLSDAARSRLAAFKARVRAMGIRDRPTSFRSPWQNGQVERLIGSARRECTNHLIVFNEDHLRRILAKYGSYYNEVRTHL